MNFSKLKDKQYVPKHQNEIVWAYYEDENLSQSIVVERIMVFRLATKEEKKAFVEKESATLDADSEIDMSSYQEFLERDSYLTYDFTESELEMVHPDYIVAPAFNENGEPIDVYGNPMLETPIEETANE